MAAMNTMKNAKVGLVVVGILLALALTSSTLFPGWKTQMVLGSAMPHTSSTDEAQGEAGMTANQAAEEPARYNFASVQGAGNLRVAPGGEASGQLRFYNVDGNRTTHIALEVVEAPSNWEVVTDPPLHEQEVSLGGDIITVTENLYVEPTEVLSEEIEDVPEGMTSLTLSNKLGPNIPGYALAKVVSITIRVPKSCKAGTNGEVRIRAVASWLGQTGTATIGQTRDFRFTVRTDRT